MRNFLLTHAWALVSGPVIGALVFACHEGLQKAWGWLDGQSPVVKRVVAFLLAAVLTPLASALGVAVPAACSTADMDLAACVTGLASNGWLTAAIGGGVALVLHAVVRPGKTSVVPTP